MDPGTGWEGEQHPGWPGKGKAECEGWGCLVGKDEELHHSPRQHVNPGGSPVWDTAQAAAQQMDDLRLEWQDHRRGQPGGHAEAPQYRT